MTDKKEKRAPLERCVMCLHYRSSPQGVVCHKRKDGPLDNGMGWCPEFTDIVHSGKKEK